MGEHFDEMTCLLYLDKQLEPERTREIASHVSGCAECRVLLRTLDHEGTWLREALDASDESIPARLLEAPSRARTPWGWMMTLGFGSIGAYALWGDIVEPWQQQFAQAGFTQGNFLTMLFFSGAFWKGWGEMRNLVEVLATLSVLGIVAALLRHNWRRLTTVGMVMAPLGLLLGLSLAFPSPASAGEMHHGEPNFTVPAGETINTDLFVGGEIVRIDGDVNGDVFVWSQSVIIGGHVTGDVVSFAQEVRINGRVDGNVRSWSQSLAINGTVGKNVMAFCGTAVVDEKGSVGGSLTLLGGQAELNGPINRDILGSIGSIEMNNLVGGNIRIKSRDITIGSNAVLRGQVSYRGDHPPRIDSAAKVTGPVQAIYEEHIPAHKRARTYWHFAFHWAAAFLFGLVLMLIVPGFFGDVVRASNQPWLAGGVGILVLPGVFVAALIACITLVGLAVGIATLLIYGLAIYSAQIVVGVWIGERILGEGMKTSALLGRLALGLLILGLLKAIPWVGGFVLLAQLIWGLGAIGIAVYHRVRPNLAAGVAVPA
jgi:cytoskeletal protein CcmA (bactofilin family)